MPTRIQELPKNGQFSIIEKSTIFESVKHSS